MRRFLYLVLILVMFLLAACAGNEQEDSASEGSQSEEKGQEETDEQSMSVDKGLLNVEITLPASMFEGEDIDTVIAEAKAEGVDEVTKNEDGSITYKMSKAKHREMMKEMETSTIESIEEMKTSEDFASIKDVTYNKDFTEFTMVVDREVFENSFDGFAVLGLGMQGSMYHIFSGKNPDDYKVTISVKDEATQEVFDQTILPDDFEETEEEGKVE